jgi:outer membrane lipoprotein SlyB
MKPTVSQPFTFTVFSALSAAAALTLAACSPSDSADATQFAAGPATTSAAPIAPAQVAPASIERAGTPVPVAAVAPAPAVAPLPPTQVAAAQPVPAPTPAMPAQSGRPVPPAPAGYAPAPDDAALPSVPAPHAVDRSRVGAITGIEPIRERPEGTGTGAVIGGVLGGVLGNQFGHGTGRAVMTGAGAVGGAIAGNNIERNRNTRVVGYRVSVRLDNGTTRTFQRTQVGDLHVGDRVALDARSFHRV